MQVLNVIDTAIRTGIFQTFTRLLEGSDLEQRLRSKECFTVFAPVDIAFAYLDGEAFDQLLKAESQGVLADILGYHAVPGKILFHDLRLLDEAETLHGRTLTFNSEELRVEGAKLLHVDIVACNGVIHGIDRLLMPGKSAATASR